MASENDYVCQVAYKLSAEVVFSSSLSLNHTSTLQNIYGHQLDLKAYQSVWELGEHVVQRLNKQHEVPKDNHEKLISAFVSGNDVPLLVPYLYKVVKSTNKSAEQAFPFVLYVIGQREAMQSITETGFVVVTASTPQEFVQLSLVANIMALRQGVPCCVWLTKAEANHAVIDLELSKENIQALTTDLQLEIPQDQADNPGRKLVDLFQAVTSCKGSMGTPLLAHQCSCIDFKGDASAARVVVAFPDVALALLEYMKHHPTEQPIGVVTIYLNRPWSAFHFVSVLPKSTTKIYVLDATSNDFASSPPALFLDVAGSFHSGNDIWGSANIPSLISMKYKGDGSQELAKHVVSCIASNQIADFNVATPETLLPISSNSVAHPPAAKPYLQMLHTAFGNRLRIEDASSSHSIEVIFGEYVALIQSREMFAEQVLAITKANAQGSNELKAALKQWYSGRTQATTSEKYGNAAVRQIELELPNAPHLVPIYEQRHLFFKLALWILGAENWVNDLQRSGIHHTISSGVNVNVMLLDTQVYPSAGATPKKDVGLYAMNYGNTYVASVALYNNYTHVLHSLLEAEAFEGPSLVLAYLPVDQQSASTSLDTIQAMKNSKIAVDTGVWPLYRWNPEQHKKDGKGFTLESERIKKDLKEFLDKENELSLIINQIPDIPFAVPQSLDQRMSKLEESFGKLAAGIAPLLILYGSDTGHAESLAKKMEAKGKRNKRNARALPLDDVKPADLASEPTVLFLVATAGQGEFTANSKEFWKAIHKLSINDLNLEKMNYSVFGLGDSHYWPAPSGELYYCKPARELDSKLEDLGGKKLHPLGLGDDQDADGYLTGFALWEQQVWEYLGVGGDPGAAPTITDDQNKLNSNFLRGTIAKGLEDTSTGALAEMDTKILKFHGSYQQDDRDLRDARKAQGLEKAFSFMVRLRIPGGIVTPQQYLALDSIADQYASTTLRLTTRQTIQYHGIIKKNLRTAMQAINKTLLDTIAACGDVNRNVLCTSNPALAPDNEIHQELVDLATNWSVHMLPKTGAYREIWLDDKLVKGGSDTIQDFEPIYGPTYLPRKFKAVVAIPPYNDVDIYAHDLGYIAIVENGAIVGYNVTVGGGMGMTHGNKKTFPRVADVLGFVEKHQAIDVGEKVVLVQRDHGDRTNRKHARLKYTIEDHGIDWFRTEVEARLGYKLQPARPFHFTDNSDRYGWIQGNNNKWHYTMFIQNGRVKDSYDYALRTGLRELAKIHKGDFRFTANQNLIISNVDSADKETIEAMMEKYKILNKRHSSMRLNSMACVALPTCGLAFAESERYLPSLISAIDEEINALGLWDEAITIRMTGCPNGCARPYVAEIGLVGKAPGIYNLYIGGGFAGQRLNKLYKEAANEKEILEALKPLLQQFAKSKQAGEHFGDFVIRTGVIKPVLISNTFHD